MQHWNTVVTVREGGFGPACRFLAEYGEIKKSEFFNTLVMWAEDPFQVLDDLQGRLTADSALRSAISRFMPLERMFVFQTAAGFELRAQEAVLEWLPRLARARFHVRMHRRGFKGKLSSVEEERFLDDFLLNTLAEAGTPGKVTFDDPDAIIAVETVGSRGGVSCFHREDLKRFTLLHID